MFEFHIQEFSSLVKKIVSAVHYSFVDANLQVIFQYNLKGFYWTSVKTSQNLEIAKIAVFLKEIQHLEIIPIANKRVESFMEELPFLTEKGKARGRRRTKKLEPSSKARNQKFISKSKNFKEEGKEKVLVSRNEEKKEKKENPNSKIQSKSDENPKEDKELNNSIKTLLILIQLY